MLLDTVCFHVDDSCTLTIQCACTADYHSQCHCRNGALYSSLAQLLVGKWEFAMVTPSAQQVGHTILLVVWLSMIALIVVLFMGAGIGICYSSALMQTCELESVIQI